MCFDTHHRLEGHVCLGMLQATPTEHALIFSKTPLQGNKKTDITNAGLLCVMPERFILFDETVTFSKKLEITRTTHRSTNSIFQFH